MDYNKPGIDEQVDLIGEMRGYGGGGYGGGGYEPGGNGGSFSRKPIYG